MLKLRSLGSLLSLITLGLAIPACGDDDSSSDDDTEDTDTDDGDGGTDTDTEGTETDTDTEGTETDTDTEGTETDTDTESTETDTDEGDGGNTETEDTETEDPGDGGTTETETEETEDTETETDDTETETEGPDPVECPDVEDRDLVIVNDELSGDLLHWTCDNVYVLDELTYVLDGDTLVIDPGVEVWGEPAAALVITRGGRIEANGTVDAPIVLTSSAIPGERQPSDWGGLVMLGAAPVNRPGGEDRIEGLVGDAAEAYGSYGGDDEAHDCGSLRYVRVEFAGFEVSDGNELNGISVAGCGSETTINYVQVHKGSDDGIEFWGGAPQVSHLVLSSNSDDSLDWDSGFQGTMQFVVIQQDPDDGDNGIEADNYPTNHDAEPRSNPTIYNMTLIGGGTGSGAVLRVGTWGKIYNSIFMNNRTASIDVRDAASAAGAEGANPGLTVENSLFFNNGADGVTHFNGLDNAAGFDEEAFFTAAARNNVFDEDPELGDPTNLTSPDFVPAAGSVVGDGALTPPAGFDRTATYLGAFEPGGEDWTAGWTAYPAD